MAYDGDPSSYNSAYDLNLFSVDTDGVVDVADVLLVQQLVTNKLVPAQYQLDHGDVAPLINGAPLHDGLFNLGDLLVIQCKALGLVNF